MRNSHLQVRRSSAPTPKRSSNLARTTSSERAPQMMNGSLWEQVPWSNDYDTTGLSYPGSGLTCRSSTHRQDSLRQEQDQAQLLLLLFCPFTLNEERCHRVRPFHLRHQDREDARLDARHEDLARSRSPNRELASLGRQLLLRLLHAQVSLFGG